MPLLERDTAPDDDPAESPSEADVELIESQGRWTLRLTRPLRELADAPTVSIRVYPNLVPGLPFDADVEVGNCPAGQEEELPRHVEVIEHAS